jgi:hypothetical protein
VFSNTHSGVQSYYGNIDAKTETGTTPSGIIASAERMKQNTDSMIEDAVISQKLK